MNKRVVVVGSINTDLIIKIGRLPKPGETIVGGRFSKGGGGKGANQAIAAVRAGGGVSFVARVGNDSYGNESVRHLIGERIDTKFVVRDEGAPTGVAFILVDDLGENSIVVASGANENLSPGDVEKAKHEILSAGVLLVQLESPIETVQSAINLAAHGETLIILNPAPAQYLSGSWLRGVDIITPNKIEAEILTDLKITDDASLRLAGKRILEFGIETVIITLGRRGVFLATARTMRLIPAYGVRAIDSIGAGDVFSGSLAAFLAEGISIDEAVRMSIAAASISVTRRGAQTSAPSRAEIENFLNNSVPFEQEHAEDTFTHNPSQSL